MGPARYRVQRVTLTSIDNPDWVWELHKMVRAPLPSEPRLVSQTEVTASELLDLTRGVLRFLHDQSEKADFAPDPNPLNGCLMAV